MGPLLHVQDVSLRFGGIVALDGVSFGVAQDSIVGLIGPNGAGINGANFPSARDGVGYWRAP